MEPPETIPAGEVVLRRWEPRWAEPAAAAIRSSFAELAPFLSWVDAGHDTADTLAFIERSQASWAKGTEFNYAILTAQEEFAGSIGLMTRMGPGILEIGYWMGTSHTGRGYTTAAVRALTSVALTLPGAARLVICHDVANAASGAVARRAGFVETARVARDPQAPGDTGTDVIRDYRP